MNLGSSGRLTSPVDGFFVQYSYIKYPKPNAAAVPKATGIGFVIIVRPMYDPIPDKVLQKVGLPPLDLSDKPTKENVVLQINKRIDEGKAP